MFGVLFYKSSAFILLVSVIWASKRQIIAGSTSKLYQTNFFFHRHTGVWISIEQQSFRLCPLEVTSTISHASRILISWWALIFLVAKNNWHFMRTHYEFDAAVEHEEWVKVGEKHPLDSLCCLIWMYLFTWRTHTDDMCLRTVKAVLHIVKEERRHSVEEWRVEV